MATSVTETRKGAAKTMKRAVVHLSPYRNTRGGISSVVMNYTGSPLTRDYSLDVIETHADGNGRYKAKVMLKAVVQATKRALTAPPDIVHVHVGDFPSLYRKALILLPFRLAKSKKLLHFHGAAFVSQYEAKGPLEKWLVRRIICSFDKVICLSRSWQDDLRRLFGVRNSVVVQNSVPLPDETAPKRAPGAPLQLLFLGLIGDRKGLFDLLDAAEILAEQGVDVRLDVGGVGEVERLEARIEASAQLKSRIRFHGWVGLERRRELCLAANVFVLPSYAEGMPMAVMETMAFGLPIVSTPVGGIPELVAPGRNGYLVTPGDVTGLAAAIRTLNDDEALRAQMGRRSRQVIETGFDFATHLSRIGDVYDSLGVRR